MRKLNIRRVRIAVFAMRYKMIGLKIAYYRKLRGYTQNQLAGKIGISTTYLGQIERGNNGKSYSLETLLLIAGGLEIDVNLLLNANENI